ncbi:MAG: hypothetical protein GQ564_23660 [Bacteroidales bacterium]|nr:hypothetical protein [Bacteroidales bacterium]
MSLAGFMSVFGTMVNIVSAPKTIYDFLIATNVIDPNYKSLAEYQKPNVKSQIKEDVFICFKDGAVLKRDLYDLLKKDYELYRKLISKGHPIRAKIEKPHVYKDTFNYNDYQLKNEPVDIGWLGYFGLIVAMLSFSAVLYFIFLGELK